MSENIHNHHILYRYKALCSSMYVSKLTYIVYKITEIIQEDFCKDIISQ